MNKARHIALHPPGRGLKDPRRARRNRRRRLRGGWRARRLALIRELEWLKGE